MAAAGYYAGAIDGKIGPQTNAAADKLLGKYNLAATNWTATRRAIAAGQIVLDKAGYHPGAADGLAGYNTNMALAAWDNQKTRGTPLVVDRTPIHSIPRAGPFPLQKDCPEFYGAAGTPEVPNVNIIKMELPFALRLDWDLSATVKTIQINKKCAETAHAALTEARAVYGGPMLAKLGLDRYAGCYVPRAMRGGTAPSMHAYGAAMDFFAAPNGLHAKCPEALFCKKAYVEWFDIWEKNGWLSLGREIGRDFMHVQAARLR